MNNRTCYKLTEIIASIFILLFIYTAISKFSDPTSFRMALHKLPVIGTYAWLVAWAVPVTELIIALLLFIPATRIYGLYSSFFIMIIFAIYTGAMIAFAPTLPCSCGGVLKRLGWREHLIFNIDFVLLAITGILLSRPNHLFIAINRRSRKPV